VGVLKYMAEKPEDTVEKGSPAPADEHTRAALSEGGLA
jgi:hypothetical protein